MAYLIKDHRRNPATGRQEPRYRIGDRHQGVQVTGQLGYASDLGPNPDKEAQRQLTIYQGRRAAGENPAAIWARQATPAPEPASTTPVTLTTIWNRYLLGLLASGAAEATVASARFSWAAWSELAAHAPEVVSVSVVDAVVARWREDFSDRTIQLRVLLLTRLLQRAYVDGDLVTAPRVKVPSVRETREHRWLTPAQQRALLDVLPWGPLRYTRTTDGQEGGSDGAPGSAMAIYLGLQLGLRPGEALSRRWSHVRFDAPASLDIHANDVKTRSGRDLPLSAPVVARLREEFMRAGRDPTALLCAGVTDIRSALRAASVRAGVPLVTPHGLRHSWASRLAMEGVDRASLMRLGGWTSGEMLDEVYAHVHDAHLVAQVERTAL